MNVFVDLLRTSANKITSVFVFKLLTVTVLITQIFKVYLKALLNIPPTSPEALYFDLIIFVLILFTTCTMFLNFKNIITNKIDIIFLVFLLFGIFEIFWTYYLTKNLFISIFRFRLYFIPYFLYISFRYFLKTSIIFDILKITKAIAIISFSWTILEFFLINTNVIHPKTVIAFLSRAITNPAIYPFGIYIVRGYGVLADVISSGIFYLICLTIFLPEMIYRQDLKAKFFVFLGISGVVYSLSKTAWALFCFVLLLMLLYHKNKRKLLIMLLIVAVLEIYSISVMHSMHSSKINTTLITTTHKYFFLTDALPENTKAFFSMTVYRYINHLFDFFHGSITAILFGHGYDVSFAESKLFNIKNIDESSWSIGVGIFFVTLLRQLGIIGITLYFFTFIILPLVIYFKNKNSLIINGIALSLVVAGFSSIHSNSIFRSGINVLVCFLLAALSVMHYELQNGEKKSTFNLYIKTIIGIKTN